MKKILIILFLFICGLTFSQNVKPQKFDGWWDGGVPIMPDDQHIMEMINELGDSLRKWDYVATQSKAKACREIGLAFYDRGLYDAADWYLTKSKNYREEYEIEKVEPKITENEKSILNNDRKILENLSNTYDNLSRKDLKNLVQKVEGQIKKLMIEKDSLIKINASKILIDSKNGIIKTLKKEKDFIILNIKNLDLKDENLKIRKYLIWAFISITILILGIVALSQRKTIKIQDKEIENQIKELSKKNTYLEYAAKLIRHDMHSGINTYIPKGISTLEKKITPEDIKKLKIGTSIKMIKDGLQHTQKVYSSVYEFTNLVKQNIFLEKVKFDIKSILEEYLLNTAYNSQVTIEYLGELKVNKTLFCNAIDNLIRNGLKYNDNENKKVKIYLENNVLIIEDNGRGFSQKEFDKIVNNYDKIKNKDIDTLTSGLGLNISLIILQEHGFNITCEKTNIGTKMKIKLK
jgi:K+-sensing histidine kinase KdpD